MTNYQGQQPNPNTKPNLYSQDAGSILWEIYNKKTKGIFRKKVISESHTYITDKRIVHDNQEIPLQEISDVVILNRHSASQAQMTHYSYRYSNMRSGVGDIKSKSKSLGDIIVITPNPNIMDLIITNVVDPRGIRDLILALRKNLLAQLDK